MEHDKELLKENNNYENIFSIFNMVKDEDCHIFKNLEEENEFNRNLNEKFKDQNSPEFIDYHYYMHHPTELPKYMQNKWNKEKTANTTNTANTANIGSKTNTDTAKSSRG
jgi:hypothetical protein